MTTLLDVLAAICLLAGSFLAFAAGLGLLRFPDLLARSHAATKPQVLGLLLMLLGLGLSLRDGPAGWMLVLVALFPTRATIRAVAFRRWSIRCASTSVSVWL